MGEGSAVFIEPVVPLTERILARVGQPRPVWILIWGFFPFATYEVAYRLLHIPGYRGIGFSISGTYVVILSLWGIGKITRGLTAIQPLILDLSEQAEAGAPSRPFRLVGSVAGPLLLNLAVNLVYVMDVIRHPGLATAVMWFALYIAWLPGNCAVWFCTTLFLGLDNLGRRPLRLKPFHQDSSLGLGPLGRLAFSAYLLLAAGVAPFAIVGTRDVRSAVVALGITMIATIFFFMSVSRLHLQLVSAKMRYFAHLRHLYAQAFRPLENAWSLEALSEQSGHLSVTEVLHRQIVAIQGWPFDEAIVARVVLIATSVAAIVAARLILSRFGL